MCNKPVELSLINYGAPFQCQNCHAMLDISSLYEWLTHVFSGTVAFIVLWKVLHLRFWFAVVGAIVLLAPLRRMVRSITTPIVPLEPSNIVK
jgi:hypothetical protein